MTCQLCYLSSGTSNQLASNFVRQMNDELKSGECGEGLNIGERLKKYCEMCQWVVERNVTIYVSSSEARYHATSSHFRVPVEDLPALIEDQCRHDGVLFPSASVSSALLDAGLPLTDLIVVSIRATS
jgi:hypothetical protein